MEKASETAAAAAAAAAGGALELCGRWSLIDIGINLTDEVYRGKYRGKRQHPDDTEAVLARAARVGVSGLLVTGGNLRESRRAVELCLTHNNRRRAAGEAAPQLLCTAGCHPTRCSEFLEDPDGYYASLEALLQEHSVRGGGCIAAVGEVGLDYDRLHFCAKEVQRTYFERQLALAERFQLPLFLHDRNTAGDFYDVMAAHAARLPAGGVVHSFTGTREELRRYLDLGLYIGINGCSLKTEENLAAAAAVPLDRLLIETDGPYCDVRNTHASRARLTAAAAARAGAPCVSDAILAQFATVRPERHAAGALVKGRVEPCHVVTVLEVLYELHRDRVGGIAELADIVAANTRRLFPFGAPEVAGGQTSTN